MEKSLLSLDVVNNFAIFKEKTEKSRNRFTFKRYRNLSVYKHQFKSNGKPTLNFSNDVYSFVIYLLRQANNNLYNSY